MSKSRIHPINEDATRILENALVAFELMVGATVAYTLFFAGEPSSLLLIFSL